MGLRAWAFWRFCRCYGTLIADRVGACVGAFSWGDEISIIFDETSISIDVKTWHIGKRPLQYVGYLLRDHQEKEREKGGLRWIV